MSQIVPTSEKIQNVQSWLSSKAVLGQLKMALPRAGVTPERFARIVMTEVRRTPKLAECSIESLLGAAMTAAQLGLEPGPMGLAYLIPYAGEVTLQVGYKGLLALAWRSEQIQSVQAEVVRQNDTFKYANGIPPELNHVPAAADRGEPTHAYAIVGTTSGGWLFRVMTADEIREHQKRFSKAKTGPWITDWDEMACKTVLKRTLKRAPISTELQRAVDLDDRYELGVPQEIDVTPPGAEDGDGDGPKPEPKADAKPEPKQASLGE